MHGLSAILAMKQSSSIFPKCLQFFPPNNSIRSRSKELISSRTFSDIEHIWQMCWRTSFYRGGPVFMSALSGIDIALWDLKGEYRTMSVNV